MEARLCLATEPEDDSGLAHSLEHLIFQVPCFTIAQFSSVQSNLLSLVLVAFTNFFSTCWQGSLNLPHPNILHTLAGRCLSPGDFSV